MCFTLAGCAYITIAGWCERNLGTPWQGKEHKVGTQQLPGEPKPCSIHSKAQAVSASPQQPHLLCHSNARHVLQSLMKISCSYRQLLPSLHLSGRGGGSPSTCAASSPLGSKQHGQTDPQHGRTNPHAHQPLTQDLVVNSSVEGLCLPEVWVRLQHTADSHISSTTSQTGHWGHSQRTNYNTADK